MATLPQMDRRESPPRTNGGVSTENGSTTSQQDKGVCKPHVKLPAAGDSAAGNNGDHASPAANGDLTGPGSAADGDGDGSTDRPPLTCAMCGHHFRCPKILPCLHTFCQQCLRSHAPAESLAISCPSCKQQSILPPDGVSGLQTNRLLDREPDPCRACCGTGTCPDCVSRAQEEPEEEEEEEESGSESDDAETAAGRGWQLFCANHAGQTLRFFCRDCETAVCASCTDILHARHSTCRLSETGPEQRRSLQTLRHRVAAQMDVQQRRRALLTSAGDQLRQARSQAEHDLHAYCDALVDAVNRRRQALASLLSQIYRQRAASIEDQVGRLDAYLSELDSCGQHVERALQSGSDTEVLLINKQVAVRVGDAGLPEAPAHTTELRFEPTNTDRLEAQLACFGSISSGGEEAVRSGGPSEPDHGCRSSSRGHSEPDQGSSEDLILDVPPHTPHSNGQVARSDVSSERSSAERLPPPRTPRSLSRASPSALSCGSRSSRSSHASLPSSRRSSRRSAPPPAPPAEDDLVLAFGTKGRARGEFSNPQGVCYAAASDRLLVADSNNQCVQVFSMDGECKLRFGVRGRGPGQMQRPCGVASTPDGLYVVSDFENRCLSVFDPLGKLVRRIGHGKLQGPKGVTTDRSGDLLVVDNRGSAVVTFSPGGRLVARFGTRGTGQHQFAGPHYVAVDSQHRVVVTDFHNHSVKVFSPDGKHLFSFGGNGEAAGQFNAPTGVTTDRYDNILVADWGNSRVQVFDNSGRYLSTVDSSATPLYGPQGLAMSPDGHVIVADTGNHAVKLYTYHPLPA